MMEGKTLCQARRQQQEQLPVWVFKSGWKGTAKTTVMVMMGVAMATTGLLPVVNFIYVLQTASMLADPESAKKTVKLSVFFVLLESECAKAAHRMLMKLTSGCCLMCTRPHPISFLFYWGEWLYTHTHSPIR